MLEPRQGAVDILAIRVEYDTAARSKSADPTLKDL
jgi:hypothetical protein